MRIVVSSLVLFVVVIVALGPTRVCAQESTARVSGVVTDTNGAVLPGARVELQQKGSVVASAITDGQGKFAFSYLASGDYTLVVNYVGFSKFETPVAVTAGKVERANAVLSVASESESVIVTAERAHGEAEAINEEKMADNILNVLPAQVITSLPNANIADAVGRLPGVTLERDEGEGKYVQIRGTEPRLANLTLDGVEVPSPDGAPSKARCHPSRPDRISPDQQNAASQHERRRYRRIRKPGNQESWRPA